MGLRLVYRLKVQLEEGVELLKELYLGILLNL